MGVWDKIVFLNFDDTLVPQRQLLVFPHEWIELKDIRGTRMYAEPTSLRRIVERISQKVQQKIVLLGCGDFHYVTHLLLMLIKRPFTLLLFDNHSELISPLDSSLISCGSWIAASLNKLVFLKRVVIIGADAKTFCQVAPSFLPRVLYVPYCQIDDNIYRQVPSYLRWFLKRFPPITELGIEAAVRKLISYIPTATVYISIDKDVLRPQDAVTNWDQGMMNLEELLVALREVSGRKRVWGVDICGEMPLNPVELMRVDGREIVEKNMRANFEIISLLMNLGALENAS
ncbi:MAG: Arginase [Thermoanaerobacterales bacterium 50_218]|nr:MAG: Arginase [Thermoanaerobacterales bacterium 50_218]HAA89502.1 arginase [Peptococcaceae bacterium]